MQVSVEQTSELKRKMKVQVPEETIQSECAKRIDSLARNAKIKGYRPGKIPLEVIRRRFGDSVRNEVISEMIRSTMLDTFKSHEILPAGTPHIDSAMNEAGKGLEFEASFEVYPSVELQPFNTLTVVRPLCEISEAQLNRVVEDLRLQHRKWRVVEREAVEKDKVTLSFGVKIDGEVHNDGRIEQSQIEIGQNRMIPGFEDQLIGLKAGDQKNFTLNFPQDYFSPDYAGKSAEFDLSVQKVEEALLPELDSEFFNGLGIATDELETFRSALKQSMEFEKAKAVWNKTKAALLDAIIEAHATLLLPEVMVNQQIDELRKQHEASHPGCDSEHPGHRLEDYEAQARRMVKLGLLLAEIAKREQIRLDSSRVRNFVEHLARDFENPQEVAKMYYANPEQLKSIETLVLEDQILEFILDQANVVDEPVDYFRLTSPFTFQ